MSWSIKERFCIGFYSTKMFGVLDKIGSMVIKISEVGNKYWGVILYWTISRIGGSCCYINWWLWELFIRWFQGGLMMLWAIIGGPIIGEDDWFEERSESGGEGKGEEGEFWIIG